MKFTTQVLRNLFEIPAELGIAPAGDHVDAAETPPEQQQTGSQQIKE
jgi:hypothetical protein